MSFARFCILLVALHAAAATAFDFDDVAELAQLQARQAYRPSGRKAPPQLQALNYDQYRDIRFRTDRALWRSDKLPFELMFFHLGKFQKESVRIDEVNADGTRHIPYRASDFDFGKNKLSPGSWGDLGFGGFRAHYPLNSSAYKDEVVSVCFGLSSGRQIHSPSPVATIRPSESCTSGRKSVRCGWFSPKKNMLVSGAMPSVATFSRRNRRARTSITVSPPGCTSNW
jgi:glucan biosynthesis protein